MDFLKQQAYEKALTFCLNNDIEPTESIFKQFLQFNNSNAISPNTRDKLEALLNEAKRKNKMS